LNAYKNWRKSKMNINQLLKTQENVKTWAVARDFETGAFTDGQFNKLIEEFGELAGGIAKDKPNKLEVIKDSVGDMLVVLSNIYLIEKMDFADVLKRANGIIKRNNMKTDNAVLFISIAIGKLANEVNLSYPKNDFYNMQVHSINFAVDIIIGLNFVCEEYKTTLEECYALAYEEIKDRKGKMINGVFVKSEDLASE